jgi:hypothetical protein
VQWNTSPEAFEIGQPRKVPVSDDLLPVLMDYETGAARYALGLLHEIGITATDQWFANYAACDAAYLRHYYATAEKCEFLSFWQERSPLIEALAVPQFSPVMRALRSDGVVI